MAGGSTAAALLRMARPIEPLRPVRRAWPESARAAPAPGRHRAGTAEVPSPPPSIPPCRGPPASIEAIPGAPASFTDALHPAPDVLASLGQWSGAYCGAWRRRGPDLVDARSGGGGLDRRAPRQLESPRHRAGAGRVRGLRPDPPSADHVSASPAPHHQLPVLVDILRGETTTPDRCWFCVNARLRSLDPQGVTERVRLPGGGASYLMHGGPIERGAAVAARQVCAFVAAGGHAVPENDARENPPCYGLKRGGTCAPMDSIAARPKPSWPIWLPGEERASCK